MKLALSLKAGLFIFASAIGTIVAADLILRSVGYLPHVGHDWMLGKHANSRVPDDSIILARPPFLDEKFYMVDSTREIVVTLGDSFVEGYPVDPKDSYPTVLGRLLGAVGRPASVINMGIGDSGPDQHFRLFKEHLLPRLTPDIVVWSFYANDIGDNLRQAVYKIEDDSLVPLDAAKHWLYVRHKIYLSIPLPSTIKESSPVLRLLFRALEVWGMRGVRLGPDARALSGEKIRLAIEEMERLSRIHGFQAVYVLIAPQALYLREQDPQLRIDDLNIAKYEQLRTIIADQPQFVDAWFGDPEVQVCGSRLKFQASTDIFADDGRDYNRLGHRHFNEVGYHLLAEIIAACLLSDQPDRTLE